MAASIVQYVLVRSDLFTKLEWPTGAVIAQACHACSAVTHLFHDDDESQLYFSDLDRMHKVVLDVSSYKYYRVHTGQGKVRENFISSRSGKSQGILKLVREF